MKDTQTQYNPNENSRQNQLVTQVVVNLEDVYVTKKKYVQI